MFSNNIVISLKPVFSMTEYSITPSLILSVYNLNKCDMGLTVQYFFQLDIHFAVSVFTFPTRNPSDNIDTPNINLWPLTFLSWYRHFSKKWQGFKLVLWTQSPSLSEMSTLTYSWVSCIVVKNTESSEILRTRLDES